jgi:hypothetical protein
MGAALVLVACSSPGTIVDAGGGDGGAPDAAIDAGGLVRDAGTAPDAGLDAGADGGAAGGAYGPGIGADSLDNHQVADVDVDFRFRAATTSQALSLIWYNIYDIKCAPHAADAGGTCPLNCSKSGSVYACGTGGTMHICLEPDDGDAGHLATGVELACVDHPMASGPPFLPTETFSSPATLNKGVLYHLHWHNTDPSPTVNFTSVDTIAVRQATVPRQPLIPDLDLAVFRGTTERAADTPLFQLTYADGTVQGQGYLESWINAPVAVSGASQAREQFTVSGGDRTVRAVSVRLNRADGGSPLTLTLESADGGLIEQGSIPASHFPLGSAATLSATWATLPFASAHPLASGASYHLVLSAPADTVYEVYGLERGNGYGFLPPTFFADGYAEESADGGPWQGLTQPGGQPNRINADLQFYFGE